MRYTYLRLTADGIVACREHEARLGLVLPHARPGPATPEASAAATASALALPPPPPNGSAIHGESGTAFRRKARRAFAVFARDSAPGVWALEVTGNGTIVAEARPGSRLTDGMPARWAVSPLADRPGQIPKARSPSPYDDVRVPGVATLLTSPDGVEVLEACSAAVLAWDGAHLRCVPRDRPRVWSSAEAAVRRFTEVEEAPIRAADGMPLLLLNAVKGTCELGLPDRPVFPVAIREAVEAALRRSIAWPDEGG